MKGDERIRLSKRNIASKGFGIWYILLLASLLYRQFYLKQSIDQYWDIAVTFFIGTFYVSISMFAKGAVYKNRITESFKWSTLSILVTIIAVSYFLGNIASIADLITTIISAAIGVAFMTILFYFLYRRWEQNIDVP
jgi:O-antigen/teichoic acid export membrane protein